MDNNFIVENDKVTKELGELHQKLDLLLAHVAEQQRKQQELEELKDDLIHIGKDAFQAAVMELEEVSPHFESRDLVHLTKKLMRNTRNIIALIDQLENLADFFRDFQPISKDAFAGVMDTLDEMDRKGYFEFMREALKIIDTVVTSFTVDDVKLLRENITSILMTVKNITQPEMLGTMNNAVGFYRKMDIEVEGKGSYREIFKALRDPDVKRGLVFMLEFVKSMATPNGSTNNHQNQTNITNRIPKEE